MRNHLFILLIVLISSTSFNQGEKLKANDRRASGLMAYPRIGRSDPPVSNPNFNRHHYLEPDTEFQFYSSDLDSPQDKDYEEASNPVLGFVGRSMNPKQMDRIPKDALWLISDRSRTFKDYRPWQKIGQGRTLYPDSLPLIRGSRNSQLNGYTPRLGRENDIERALCK